MKRFRNLVAGAAATALMGLGMAGAAWGQKVTLDVLYAQPGFAKYHELLVNSGKYRGGCPNTHCCPSCEIKVLCQRHLNERRGK